MLLRRGPFIVSMNGSSDAYGQLPDTPGTMH